MREDGATGAAWALATTLSTASRTTTGHDRCMTLRKLSGAGRGRTAKS
jgi:hypothetical protein